MSGNFLTSLAITEGYEQLTRAKADSNSSTKSLKLNNREDIFSDDMPRGEHELSIWDTHPGPSTANDSVRQASPSDDGGKLDMFGDDDENVNENPPVSSSVSSALDIQQANQPTLDTLDSSQVMGTGGKPLFKWVKRIPYVY